MWEKLGEKLISILYGQVIELVKSTEAGFSINALCKRMQRNQEIKTEIEICLQKEAKNLGGGTI